MLWFMFAVGALGALLAWNGGVQWFPGSGQTPKWVAKIVAVVWLIGWAGPPASVWFGFAFYEPHSQDCRSRNLIGCFNFGSA